MIWFKQAHCRNQTEWILNHFLTQVANLETSDREICQTVMVAIDAHQNAKMNGGDDVDIDIPLEPV